MSETPRDGAEEESLHFDKNGYSLVLVSGRADFFLAMVFIALGQFGVLYLVAMSSPEYFFEGGQWIVPVSDFWSVNLMKGFSIALTFFRATGEFREATKIFHVLSYEPKKPISQKTRALGICAFVLQYIVATLVLLMAIHLILASTTPIATLGKLWVVYIVLDFDNHWCVFALYILHLQDQYEWTVVLIKSRSMDQVRQQSLLCYFGPVAIGVFVVFVSVLMNVCPLTQLHYGNVRNAEPVLMMTSTLGLPQGCCPPQVAWGNLSGKASFLPANVSVPCLSPSKDVAPVVYYVILPDGRTAPSSLQVMEGRGGDGNVGLRHGSIQTQPLQMLWWLSKHGFAHKGIYQAMKHDSAGAASLGLYTSTWPFVAHWEINDFAWTTRVRIYATARNPSTGALSPTPVESAVILQKFCPSHCLKCDTHSDACLECEPGYVHDQDECRPCASNCGVCNVAGADACDKEGCAEGYGWSWQGAKCLPCAGGDLCQACHLVVSTATGNLDAAASVVASAVDQVAMLPCHDCKEGYGLTLDFGCQNCQTKFCSKCTPLDKCEECLIGHVLTSTSTTDQNNHTVVHEECAPCASHCSKCEKLGAGKCDPEQCDAGFSLSPMGVCKACSPYCKNCTLSGPDKCDPGECKPGFGLQGQMSCQKCQDDHCDKCEESKSECDVCSEGYGRTLDRSCEACTASCKSCIEIGHCGKCIHGYGLDNGLCFACADQCQICDHAGPGLCDEGKCSPGWVSANGPAGEGHICVVNASAHDMIGSFQI